MEGIVTGTAFFSSTILLAEAVVIHRLALRSLLCSSDITWPPPTTSSRGLPSGTSSPTWRYTSVSAVALTAPLWPAALIAAAEPTYKFAANIKYSRYQDVARMGRRELARGAFFTALLAVFYYI